MKNYSRQYILIAFLFLIGVECLSQNRIKKTDYEYDLISGNVKQVTYQANRQDTYVQQYTYDADNRITEVRSSSDGVIFNRDAAYTYYQHGPLARTLLGDNKVQGLDYTYTLQGWIKGVNSNVMDMVKDPGKDGQLSTKTGRDVFSYSLGYYNGDYAPIAGSMQFLATVSNDNLDAPNSGLFNGNIRHMVTSLTDNTGVQMEGQGYVYRYDQLNRIKKSEMFLLNKSTNSFGTGLSTLYKETFTYDANGNISGLTRNGNNSTSPQMDQLSYVYAQEGGKKMNNRLLHVNDGMEASPLYANDIEDQGEFVSNDPATWNYQYDAIGNLVKDKQEEIEEITWTVKGKIKTIHRIVTSTKPDLEFRYDAMGNRIAKIEKPSGYLTTPSQWTYTYYVLNAKGIPLAIYVKKPQGGESRIRLMEQYVHGIKRLGSIHRDLDVTDPFLPMPNATPSFERVLGKRQYELTNHLGNVLSVVSDKRNAYRSAGGALEYYQAQVVSATDYYAFGNPMPGRDKASNNYRYGFNGKENDREANATGHGTQDYGMRIYNPSLGRFLSVDPIAQSYPWNSPYQFASNKPIAYIDNNGLEELHYVVTLGYKIEQPEGLWRYIPFFNRPKVVITEGVISDVTVRESVEDSYSVTIKVPQVYAHNQGAVQYKEYSYSSSSLEGLNDPKNWERNQDLAAALQDGFKNGTIAGLTSGVVPIGLKAGYTAVRNSQMSKWVDVGQGIGKKYRPHEISTALEFEMNFATRLKPGTGIGDFIGVSGRFKNKVIDAMGSPLQAFSDPKFMTKFLSSVDDHFGKLKKGVDNLLIDFRNFNKGQIKEVMEHINSTYSKEEISKLIIMNGQ